MKIDATGAFKNESTHFIVIFIECLQDITKVLIELQLTIVVMNK